MALREVFAKFFYQQDQASFAKVEGGLGELISGAKQAAAAFAGVFAVQELAQFGQELLHESRELDIFARRIGLTAEEMLAWKFAASSAGVAIDQLEGPLRDLQIRAADAASGNKEYAKTFAQFGIETKDAAGGVRDVKDLVTDMANAVQGANTRAQKLFILDELGGDEAQNLLPLLEGGAEGVQKLFDEFEALGGSDGAGAFVQAGRDAERAMARLDAATAGLRNRFKAFFLDTLAGVVSWLQKASRAVQTFFQYSSRIKALQAIFVAFGAAVSVALAPVILKVALIAAAFAGVYLLVEDLIVLFEGGDSAVGRFIDSLLGAGTAAEQVTNLKAGWEDLIRWFKGAGIHGVKAFFQVWWDLAQGVFDFIAGRIRAIIDFVRAGANLISGEGSIADRFKQFGVATLRANPWASPTAGARAALGYAQTGGQGRSDTQRPSLTQNITISNDNRGGDPAAIQRAVERGVRGATRDAVAALGGGG